MQPCALSSFNEHSGEFEIGAAYSFSTKTFTSGEGGMILTNDKDLSDKCFSMRDAEKNLSEPVHTVFSVILE